METCSHRTHSDARRSNSTHRHIFAASMGPRLVVLATLLAGLLAMKLAIGSLSAVAREPAAAQVPDANQSAQVDLSVAVADFPDPVLAGNTLTYTISVTNTGPDIATQITLSDTLPAEVDFSSAAPTQGNCTDDSGPVTCDLVNLAAGQTAQVIVAVRVDSSAQGPITNTASVTARQLDPDPSNSTDILAVTNVLQADLGLTKSDSPDPVTIGSDLAYTLIVANNGPDDVPGVTISDTLPMGATFVAATPSHGTCSEADGTVTCDIGTLADGTTASVTIDVTAPEAAVTVNKRFSLDGSCPGGVIPPIGDIQQPVTLWYEITNTGDTDLDGILITDTLKTPFGPRVIFTGTAPLLFRKNLPSNCYDDRTVLISTTPGSDTNRECDCSLTCDDFDTWAEAYFQYRQCGCSQLDGDCDGVPCETLCPGGLSRPSAISQDFGLCNDQEVVVTAEAAGVITNNARAYSATAGSDANPNNDTATATTRVEGTVQATDVVETPCKGVDWRLQLPALDTEECDTWIQVQNVGDRVSKAALMLWTEPGRCPPRASGPSWIECTGLLRPGSAWSFTDDYLEPGSRSGIMYSLNATDVVDDLIFADLVCDGLNSLVRLNDTEWLRFDRAYRQRASYSFDINFGEHQGEPLAVTVNRTCPEPGDPNVFSSASYVGISTDREGIRDPRAGGFAYYAPLVWASLGGLNSVIHVQNSGEECTSVELWFQRQGDCIRSVIWDILSLAPGETYRFDPNTAVGPVWQGSVWLSASQPLGIIVDTLGANHFGSYHGVPANVFVDEDDPQNFSLGTQVNYAPLIYREHQGWETTIHVQNLSSVHNAKVKVYFLDQSGGIIRTVIDWICPRGSQSFFLPLIAGLPGHWVGSARIESQDFLSPGDPSISAPRILSIVMAEKYTDPVKVSRQEAVVYNALQEMGSFDWQLGPGQSTGFTGSDVLSIPFAAKAYRGIWSELAIQNLNPNPGLTDFIIFLYDQNRLIDGFCEKLGEKEVEYIDLNDWAVIQPGFLGSLVISAVYANQEGGAALGAVAVERVGRTIGEPDVPGDESKAFEAFPLFNRFIPESGTPLVCPGQP